MNRSIILVLLFLLALRHTATSQADKPKLREMSVEEYIKKYAPIAQEEMKKAGIPASITLAQGILESNFGNSELARNANNHFGIKCHTDWTGKGYLKDDETKKECFRVYETAEESYIDHVNFLKGRANYASLFQLKPNDYKGWANGLKAAGYATNPDYSSILIHIIEMHKLYEYDKGEKVQEQAKTPAQVQEVVEQYKDKVITFNGIKTIIVQPGETIDDIVVKYNIRRDKLMKYNDLEEGDTVAMGSKVYLQNKRTTGFNKSHDVKRGETMRVISQKEGIRLWSLYRKNHMQYGDEPAVGETLCLQEACSGAPKLRSEDEIRQDISDKIDARESELRAQYEKQREDSLAKLKPAGGFVPGTEPSSGEVKIAGEPEGKATIPAQNNAYFANSIHQVGDTMPLKFHDDGLSMNVIVNQDNKVPDRDYHIVKERETLFSIAQMYYTSVDSLQKWNSLAGPIHPGQMLIVGFGEIKTPKSPEIINPTGGGQEEPSTAVAQRDTAAEYHIVKPGEGLYSIARQHHVTTSQIKQWNNLSSDNIQVGQKLLVSPGAQGQTNSANGVTAKYHKVVAHETLLSIARQYGVTLKQLRSWNKLSSDSLMVGQTLIVGQ